MQISCTACDYTKTDFILLLGVPRQIERCSSLSQSVIDITRRHVFQYFIVLFDAEKVIVDDPEKSQHRQHCQLSICENWLSWTNTETAAATPPTVMQNLLRASAQ